MIKTIVFDIGNVLAHFCWENYLKEQGYKDNEIKRIANATVNSKFWAELDRSVYKDEDIVNGCCGLDPDISEEITAFIKQSCEMVSEYDYSAELIKGLKAQGYKVYLLSNYGRTNYRYAADNFTFIGLTDGSVISYEVGYVKPEREIYEALINKYKINPGEAVFIDDVKANVEAAARIGFKTIHFATLEKAAAELDELGVKLHEFYLE